MEGVSATRTELLLRRAQRALAEAGRDLLREKRNALMREFQEAARVVLAGENALERAAADARDALEDACACDGPERVRSAALAASADVHIEATAASVMGVSFPCVRPRTVARSRTGRGYSLAATSPRIDGVAERFEEEIDLFLEIAAHEPRARRLAAEIGKTTRRVNALERVVIPRLRREADAIEAVLDEREREDRFRLKRARARRTSPKGGGR